MGFIGSKRDAFDILKVIEIFLKTRLLFECNKDLSTVVHGSKGFSFLGVSIRWTQHLCKQQSYFDLQTLFKSDFQCKAIMRLPILNLIQRYVEKGFFVMRKSDCRVVRATADRRIATLSVKQIVSRYNLIIRGLLNYYSFINQKSDLWAILTLLRKSCALTLAFKLKLRSSARVFTKFGKSLTIINKFGVSEVKLDAYPSALKTDIKFHLGGVIEANVIEQVYC